MGCRSPKSNPKTKTPIGWAVGHQKAPRTPKTMIGWATGHQTAPTTPFDWAARYQKGLKTMKALIGWVARNAETPKIQKTEIGWAAGYQKARKRARSIDRLGSRLQKIRKTHKHQKDVRIKSVGCTASNSIFAA